MDNKVFAPFKDLFSSSSIASSWTLGRAAMTFVPIAREEGGVGGKNTQYKLFFWAYRPADLRSYSFNLFSSTSQTTSCIKSSSDEE